MCFELTIKTVSVSGSLHSADNQVMNSTQQSQVTEGLFTKLSRYYCKTKSDSCGASSCQRHVIMHVVQTQLCMSKMHHWAQLVLDALIDWEPMQVFQYLCVNILCLWRDEWLRSVHAEEVTTSSVVDQPEYSQREVYWEQMSTAGPLCDFSTDDTTYLEQSAELQETATCDTDEGRCIASLLSQRADGHQSHAPHQPECWRHCWPTKWGSRPISCIGR